MNPGAGNELSTYGEFAQYPPGWIYPYMLNDPVQCTEEHDLEQEVTVPITRQPTKAPMQCTEPEALTGSDFQCKVSVEVSLAAAGDKEVKVNAKVHFPGTRNGVERLGKKQN